jgi:hypothetical protein
MRYYKVETGTKIKYIGEGGSYHCDICGMTRRFKVILKYKYDKINDLFGSIDDKEYLLICEICEKYGWKLDTQQIEAKIGPPAIPWMERNGWIIFAIFSSIPLLMWGYYMLFG